MLLKDIEGFMKRHDMPATTFGRLARQDPRFVLDLRMGRIPRRQTVIGVLTWMEQYEKEKANV